ncbi:MAG: hypothetical protein JXP36_19060 [Bacteroidales bacterium]|nr:hypothetical protein [Bacteroidales bacterium]
MASTSETGHAKNVANFDELLAFVKGYGANYNPSKASLKLAALQTMSNNAKNAINAVNSALPAYSNAVAAREAGFVPLRKLTTRIINSLKASNSTVQVDESARTLVRKIQGTRATAKKTDEEKAVAKAEGKETKEISSSQMGYVNRLDNFDKFIKLVASVSQYNPNEAELKVATLTNMYNQLKALNAAVVTATTPLSNARIARNELLYAANGGMVATALDIKLYVKSVFGGTSPQYKQISKLAFKTVK